MQKSKLFIYLITFLFHGVCFSQSFKFVAYADMPYTIPNDYPRYEQLIREINTENPSFSFFLGDTKSGATPCTNEYNQIVKNYFNQFNNALIYSIGDNEWTDCHRKPAGSYDTLERLDNLRKFFFANDLSFGKNPIRLVRQADVMKDHALYVENSYWVKNGFLFVSLHIPSSNNNFERNLASVQEYFKRNDANLAWIKHTFDLAKKENMKGIILGFQADMFFSQQMAFELSSGFRDTIRTLTEQAEGFQKPVLLLNGDSHRLVIDQPLKTTNTKHVLENVIRLQTMGDNQVHAVVVEVDESKEQPFIFRPLITKSTRPY